MKELLGWKWELVMVSQGSSLKEDTVGVNFRTCMKFRERGIRRANKHFPEVLKKWETQHNINPATEQEENVI